MPPTQPEAPMTRVFLRKRLASFEIILAAQNPFGTEHTEQQRQRERVVHPAELDLLGNFAAGVLQIFGNFFRFGGLVKIPATFARDLSQQFVVSINALELLGTATDIDRGRV